jgi:hypothetical protein
VLERSLDGEQQRIEVHRLGDIVGRPRPHRFDGRAHLRRRRHHDHRHVVAAAAQLGQQLHAVHDGHVEVRDDHVGRQLREPLQRGLPIGCTVDLIPFAAEQSAERRSGAGVIVHHEGANLGFSHAVASSHIWSFSRQPQPAVIG